MTPLVETLHAERVTAGRYTAALGNDSQEAGKQRLEIIRMLKAGALQATPTIEAVVTSALQRGFNIVRSGNPNIKMHGKCNQQDERQKESIANVTIDLSLRPKYEVLKELGMAPSLPMKRISALESTI